MKKRHEKVLSLLLSVMMIVACFTPLYSYANDGLVTGAEKATIKFVLLNSDLNPMSETEKANLAKDSEFYVGVKVENLGNIVELAPESNGGYGESVGDILTGLAFDHRYLIAEPDVDSTDAEAVKSAMQDSARLAKVDLTWRTEPGFKIHSSVSVNSSSSDDGEDFDTFVMGVTPQKGGKSTELNGTTKQSATIAVAKFKIKEIRAKNEPEFKLSPIVAVHSFTTVAADGSEGYGSYVYDADDTNGDSVLSIISYDLSEIIGVVPVAKEPDPIGEVNISLTAPAVGATGTTSANVSATGAANSATVSWAPALTSTGGKYTANQAYTATFTVTANNNYKFDNTATAKVNGEAADSVTPSADGKTLTVTKAFPATGMNIVTAVTVNGIDAPKSNTAFDTAASGAVATASLNGTVVTPGTVSWKKTSDNSAASGTAEAGTQYTASFTLTATTANTEFAADMSGKVTVNGATVTATRTSSSVLNVEAVFPATQKEAISKVTLTGVTAPVKGSAKPTIGVATGANYTATSTFTPEVTGTFSGETVYTQRIVVTPNSGDSFADGNITVEGIPAGVTPVQSREGSNLVLTIEWPATLGKTITAITLAGPTKDEYQYNDKVKLEGLVATVTYDGDVAQTEQVPYAKFTSKGLSCDVADGTVIGAADVAAGKKTITVSAGDTVKATKDLTVTTADVTVEWANGRGTYSQAVRDISAVNVNALAVAKFADGTVVNEGTVVVEIEVTTGGSEAEGTCVCNDGNGPHDPSNTDCSYVPAVEGTPTWKEIGAAKADGDLVIGHTPAYPIRAYYNAEASDANTNSIAAGAAGTPANGTLAITQASSGGHSGGGSGMLTVRFDAGVNGKITKGSSTVKVAKNEKLKSSDIPTVTANEGYRFLGWTLDGSKKVDPTDATVTSSVTYRALYNTGATHGVYMRGDSDGNFYPERNITRAEAAALIARLNANYSEGTKYSSSLTDVAAEEWYASAVNFCASSGLITGYDDGTFLPNNQITRQEFCAIVARYLNLSNSGEANFSDVNEDIWGAGYISQLAGKDIINGYEDGTFAPNAPIKRCEVVKILNGVFDRTPDASTVNEHIADYTVRIPDITSAHWAYYEILEAAIEHDHADFHKAN